MMTELLLNYPFNVLIKPQKSSLTNHIFFHTLHEVNFSEGYLIIFAFDMTFDMRSVNRGRVSSIIAADSTPITHIRTLGSTTDAQLLYNWKNIMKEEKVIKDICLLQSCRIEILFKGLQHKIILTVLPRAYISGRQSV